MGLCERANNAFLFVDREDFKPVRRETGLLLVVACSFYRRREWCCCFLALPTFEYQNMFLQCNYKFAPDRSRLNSLREYLRPPLLLRLFFLG